LVIIIIFIGKRLKNWNQKFKANVDDVSGINFFLIINDNENNNNKKNNSIINNNDINNNYNNNK